MPIITIPKILQEKLTDEGADALVRILDKIEVRSQSHTLEITEERFEKRLVTETTQIRVDLKSETASVKAELKEKITNVKTELNEEIVNVKAELKEEITTVRADLRITEERLGKRIGTDIANLRSELKTDMANTKSELKTDIANLRSELKTDIANTKSELIKWMFIFWIGQFASIVGVLTAILFAFFKNNFLANWLRKSCISSSSCVVANSF